MLKSIVNGAEHDIVRIPMKGKNLWSNSGFSARAITSTHGHTDTNTYGTTVSTTIGKEVTVAQSAYPTGTVAYQNGFFFIDVDFSNYNIGDKITLSFDYIVNEVHALSSQTSTTLYVGTSNNSMTPTLSSGNWNISGRLTAIITIIANMNPYVEVRLCGNSITVKNIMLNSGSTALPYEPYGYQNGWEVRDNQNRLIWGREDELQTTTGTLLFNGYDLPIKVNSLLGSAAQNGTPSPDNVVVPEFCGVMTENLAPPLTEWVDGYVASNGYIAGPGDVYKEKSSDYILIKAGAAYTFSIENGFPNEPWRAIGWYAQDKTFISRASGNASDALSTNAPSNAAYCRLSYRTFGRTTNPMLNTGSTALPYEPYGYKISFDNNGENLFDSTNITHEALDSSGSIRYESAMDLSGFIKVDGDYTVSWKADRSGAYMRVSTFDENKNFIERVTELNTFKHTYYSNSHTGYIRINYESTYGLTDIMVNIGNTTKPYSPYLNKTTPIYLGEVPTIRRIKKLVLTGNEPWIYESAYTRFYIEFQNSLIIGLMATPAFCTHFQVISDGRPLADVPNDSMYSNSNVYMRWFFKQTEYTTVDAWKSYLADQYANGTPVTIWYILANPQTGIVNEPLAKIGNYADELTDISVHNLSAPLYGIGDYKDILNLSTGVVTRKIKELVLTGKENWGSEATNMYHIPCDMPLLGYNNAISDRYSMQDSYANVVNTDGAFGISRRPALFIHDNRYTTVANFKAYLAAQYAAGTPVTVWYVLNTPTTETVTVPTGMTGEIEGYLKQISTPTPEHPSIPKWNGKEETCGTYAVTVYTLPEIPTTTGQNTLTVETEKIHGLTNPLCGIGNYKDVLNLSTGIITRKVKKRVFAGSEPWIISGSIVYISNTVTERLSPLICTHFPNETNTGMWNGNNWVFQVDISTLGMTGRDAWIAYLQQQYQNGTPVTVWYVLETPETETITVPYGLECSIEGYLTQSGTPTPSNPITPDANGILESDGTYAVEVSLDPSNLTVKGHIKPIQ